jgi:transcriptional regulator with XRE-family HTH domain
MLPDDSSEVVQALLAANLRRLRIARRLSLSELARATTMSKATLSSIESGRSNPTVDTLAALARAMRVPLTELLEEPAPAAVKVVRAARRDGSWPRRLDELAPAGELSVSELELPPQQLREVKPAPSGARIAIYVVRGKLLAGPVEQVSELGPGDYATFAADRPHVLETREHAARVLMLEQAAQ